MLEKIYLTIKTSTNVLHLISCVTIIENLRILNKVTPDQLNTLMFLFKQRCKELGVDDSILNDYVNNSKTINYEKY